MSNIDAHLHGVVAETPEEAFTKTGKPYHRVRILVRDSRSPQPESVSITVFDDVPFPEGLKSGETVLVEGALTLGRWIGYDGKQKAGLQVRAFSIERMDGLGVNDPTAQSVEKAPSRGRKYAMRHAYAPLDKRIPF